MPRKAPQRIRRITWTLLLLAGVPAIFFMLSGYQEGHDHVQEPRDVKGADQKDQKVYHILFWQHGLNMLRRFGRSYGSIDRDLFAGCSVRNCVVRFDSKRDLNSSDAVLVHLHRTRGPNELPLRRLHSQKWVFFTDESPRHTFMLTKKYSMKDYNGLFNWSMTYRLDSDVPVPYGRTVPLEPGQVPDPVPDYFQRNRKGVAIMMSNCAKGKRWEYLKELRHHIPVDFYGRCGDLFCGGNFMRDCSKLAGYKFYLAFENSRCREYLTEKLWWNAFHKNSVPVVLGAPVEDYRKLCPPDSFIHVDSFKSPFELAGYLRFLMSNSTAYNRYFDWQSTHRVLNEHGYFGAPSGHICHLCEALNSPKFQKTSSFDRLEAFWNEERDCRAD